MPIGSSSVENSEFSVARPSSLSVVRRPLQDTTHNPQRTTNGWHGGFTLLELMVVLTLILILASFAFPTYQVAIIRAREAVLRDDLFTMRSLIDQFTLDKQRPPQSLDELVEAGYLRGGVPEDPFTRSNQTWRVDFEDVAVAGSSEGVPGIVDVHSGSDELSLDGTPYSTW
jgi:general secretion pathway protein G